MYRSLEKKDLEENRKGATREADETSEERYLLLMWRGRILTSRGEQGWWWES